MKLDVPSISVVMPLYNKEREVNRALGSVFAQTVRDYELIVVNDGSTDKGPEIVHSINDPRIRILEQENAGVSGARNRGIKEAKAELVALLDADDEWHPEFLETIMRLRTNYPICDVFATNYIFRRDNNYFRQTIIRGLSNGFNEGILPNYFSVAAKSDPPLWTSAVAINKTAITSIGGFPVGVTSGEDLVTWAKLALNYKIAYSVKPKVYNWEPTNLLDRPGRIPQTPDIVAQEFIGLLSRADPSQMNELKVYVALWYEMRGVTLIQMGRQKKAMQEVLKGIVFSKKNVKLYLLATIAIMPKPVSMILYKFLKGANRLYYRVMG
jgi:glycosyltransferase involved in cell wall biosynthesis